jgi:hypothetical protein
MSLYSLRRRLLPLGAMLLGATADPNAAEIGNRIQMEQIHSGTAGGTMAILQKGSANIIAGGASLTSIPWDALDGLNSHPDIAEPPLFSEASQESALAGSDALLSLSQVGTENSLSLWLPGPSNAAFLSVNGDQNATELRAASEVSTGLRLEARLQGSANLLRLTGADQGDVAVSIEGDNNEFSIGQSALSVHSRTAVAVNGNDNAAQIFQDGTNLSLNLSFEGSAIAPIKLVQTGSDQSFSMTFTSGVVTEPLTINLPGGQ